MKNNFIYKLLNSKIFVRIVTLIILGVGIFYAYNKYVELKNDFKIAEQNKFALTDSLRISKNKVGDLTASKQILVAKHLKDLENLNLELLKEVKKFNGKVHELSTLVGNIDNGTTIIDNTKFVTLPNGDNGISFKYSKIYDDKNSRFIEGMTFFRFDSINNNLTPLPTVITRDEINFDLTQGLRTTDDGKVEMFATSSYQGFTVSELNSVIIDPKTHPSLKNFSKEKKLRFGVYSGYGSTVDIRNGTLTFGPQIGVGLAYIIW